EGALKLKEISYIHAEGYPAGEMKHGPTALIDENLPVVIVATRDANNPDSLLRYEKTMSNLKEVKARSGVVLALATEGDEEIKEAADYVLYVPSAPEALSPILEIVPLQLLAYHIAVRRGCDVDQPRNLAKSVTVEPPFPLLGTLVALEAILLASIILMRQSRMSRRAEERDHLMLQVLLLTEKEITAVLGMNRKI